MPAQEPPRPDIDPREIITPDAFHVAPELIGTPLAQPRRRAFAMLVDLTLVALLTSLIEAPGLVVGAVLAFLVYRFSRGSSDRWWKRMFRRAFGCFTAILVFSLAIAGWEALTNRDSIQQIASVVRTGVSYQKLGAADDSATRARYARDVADNYARLTGADVDSLEVLAREAEANAASGDDDDDLSQEQWAALATATRALIDSLRLPAGDVAGRPLALGPGPDSAADSIAADSVRTDTSAEAVELARLRRENRSLEDALRGQRERADDAEQRAERNTRGPITAALAVITDDLGLGLGWLGLYFTAFLVIGRGQTPGKRIARVRVIKLDGEPIGWWDSFQRFGGYSASVFTGLFGFFEIFWDDNRQGLQDKLIHSVVIDERPADERPEPRRRVDAAGAPVDPSKPRAVPPPRSPRRSPPQ